MTASTVASSSTRLTTPPPMTSPLPFRTAAASPPAPESPLAHKFQGKYSSSSLSSTLSSIEYISKNEPKELLNDTNNGGEAANDTNGDHRETLGAASKAPKGASNAAEYRSPKPLPFELYQHCWIFLEEQLYGKAITLLSNLMVSFPSKNEAFTPPPNQIAFINTLLVHPQYTTKASPSDRADISSQALGFLRNLLSILGPSNARLREAFSFRGIEQNRRSGRASHKIYQTGHQPATYGEDPIESKLANESSVWFRSHDFWQIVGWAFNCSINHPERWNIWKEWLNYMLDVIEADWKEIPNLDSEEFMAKQRADPETMHEIFQDCILVRYISAGALSSTALRRIVRAIFADGSADSVRAYPEVFEKETRDATCSSKKKRKRGPKLDLDHEKYGDYYENDEDDVEDDAPDCSQLTNLSSLANLQSRSNHTPDTLNTSIADNPEAVTSRLHLLALLSRAAFTCPNSFVSCSELYEIIVECIQPLPLREFLLFMSPPAASQIPAVALSSLAQAYLNRLLPLSAPRPGDDELTQRNLERCFLPFAANTSSVEDNAKVSILVETLFRLLTTTQDIDPTPQLSAAIEKGIQARRNKCMMAKGKRSARAKDKEDMVWLQASADRMRLLTDFAQERLAIAMSLAESGQT